MGRRSHASAGPPFLALLAALLAGCADSFFGMCGPTVMGLEITGQLDVPLDEANRTRAEDALAAMGFVAASQAWMGWTRGDETIRLYAHALDGTRPGNSTLAYEIDIPSREFEDEAQAFAFLDQARPPTFARFNLTVEPLLAAKNWTWAAEPVFHRSYAIC